MWDFLNELLGIGLIIGAVFQVVCLAAIFLPSRESEVSARDSCYETGISSDDDTSIHDIPVSSGKKSKSNGRKRR